VAGDTQGLDCQERLQIFAVAAEITLHHCLKKKRTFFVSTFFVGLVYFAVKLKLLLYVWKSEKISHIFELDFKCPNQICGLT
jgi:hypothetical protein